MSGRKEFLSSNFGFTQFVCGDTLFFRGDTGVDFESFFTRIGNN